MGNTSLRINIKLEPMRQTFNSFQKFILIKSDRVTEFSDTHRKYFVLKPTHICGYKMTNPDPQEQSGVYPSPGGDANQNDTAPPKKVVILPGSTTPFTFIEALSHGFLLWIKASSVGLISTFYPVYYLLLNIICYNFRKT